MGKEKSKKKRGLQIRLRYMAILPTVFMGIAVMIISYFVLMNSVQKEVERNLKNITDSVAIYYEMTYPGNYNVVQKGGVYRLHKGETDIMNTMDVLDKFNRRTGAEVTIYYLDVRMITTIRDSAGNRAVRSVAQPFISDLVINQRQSVFYDNVQIIGQKYYAYYTPIVNTDGTVVGMIFAGKPTYQVENESIRSVLWVPVVILIFAFIGALLCNIPARDITQAIGKEKNFLNDISKGNLNARIDDKLLRRDDELGDMARFTHSVQKFIRDMIERDALTKLYTRRVGEIKIDYTRNQLEEAGVPYCVAMGDIDFFKKFNDTYGHDCGDLVLREVARIFNENMIGKGFTVRWGGEEFLTIFEEMNLEKANAHLQKLRQQILDFVFDYNGQALSVTMTFGLTAGDNRPINDIVKEADNLLYIGKQSGRNRIVTSMDMTSMEDDELHSIPEKK